MDKLSIQNSPNYDGANSRKRTLSSQNYDGATDRKRTFSSASATSDSAESTDTDSVSGNADSFQPTSELPYSSTAQKMMAKMGYKAGKGLGKYETGRVNIIEASKQRGLRGLGLTLKGLEHDPNIKWDEEDNVMIRQDPDWIPSQTHVIPSLDELNSWVTMGDRKETVDDEDGFIEREILKDILENKTLFDNLSGHELLRARTRANPYETIRGGLFQNRAGMKMAEIDASFDHMFTNHQHRKRESCELLYFSDICAGPGGFSEYVLWKEKWHAKGFGFTIRAAGANDFKLADFLAGTPETFDCHYGENGYQGDGDIYKEKNLEAFKQYVKENSDDLGVHFVMADGGFSVEGKENIQEVLSKQLYLCQFLCALSILRIGGHFVCKVFDLFTPFSVGLVYLLYRSFEQVCIFKPVTSRPANSERYIVCKSLLKGVEPVCDYMWELNKKINNLKGSDVDIRDVVPMDLLKEDTIFYNYIFTSNNAIGERQISGLRKLITYIQNTSLVGPDQAEVRKQCLNAWDIPDESRVRYPRNDPDVQFDRLTSLHMLTWMEQKILALNKTSLQHIKSIHDYKCAFSGGERMYLFSLGRHAVFQWQPKVHKHPTWTKVSHGNMEMNLELPRFTLIDAEIVLEFFGDGRGQHKNLAVHIIDVICLGEEYVGDKSLSDRCKYAEAFTKALLKPCRNDMVRIRAKPYISMSDIGNMFNELEIKQMKKVSERKLTFSFEDGRYFIPHGVYFIRRLKEPWHLQYSRSSKRLYFYNTNTCESVYEGHKTSVADVKYCTENLLLWEMGKDFETNRNSSNVSISKEEIIDFVTVKLRT